jgi:hypothetical protein
MEQGQCTDCRKGDNYGRQESEEQREEEKEAGGQEGTEEAKGWRRFFHNESLILDFRSLQQSPMKLCGRLLLLALFESNSRQSYSR